MSEPLVLGIETTCDETAAAVVERRADGTGRILSNIVRSQTEEHAPFGGVGWSGLGRHGGRAGIEQFTEMRWITVERGGRHYPPPFLMNPKH